MKLSLNTWMKVLLFIPLILGILTLYSFNVLTVYVIFWASIAVNLLIIYETRRCKPIAIMFLFMFTYVVNTYSYYYQGEDISGGYNDFDIPQLYDFTLLCHFIFLCSIYAFLPKIKIPLQVKENLIFRKSNIGYLLALSYMLFILNFGVTGENIISSGGYGQSDKSTLLNLSLNEYFTIGLPIAYIFSGGKTYKLLIIQIIGLLFCLKDLSLGGRDALLQCSLMLFILFFDVKKHNLFTIILLVSPGVYLLLVFGMVRNNPFMVFQKSIAEILMMPITRGDLSAFLGNQNDIFYSSVRIQGLIQAGYLDINLRMTAWFSNVLALITPYKYLPEVSNIANFMRYKYDAGGGALISTYYYTFLSFPGVVAIGAYISYLIRIFLKSKNQLFILYFMMVLSTYPRWIGYNQISLFKLSFYVIPIYLIIRLTIIILKQKPEYMEIPNVA